VGLADQIFTALSANDYGVFDGLVAALAPALGDTGTAHLQSRLAQALTDRLRKAGGRDLRTSAVRRALQDIADAQTESIPTSRWCLWKTGADRTLARTNGPFL
jgi:hypothetical protein